MESPNTLTIPLIKGFPTLISPLCLYSSDLLPSQSKGVKLSVLFFYFHFGLTWSYNLQTKGAGNIQDTEKNESKHYFIYNLTILLSNIR